MTTLTTDWTTQQIADLLPDTLIYDQALPGHLREGDVIVLAWGDPYTAATGDQPPEDPVIARLSARPRSGNRTATFTLHVTVLAPAQVALDEATLILPARRPLWVVANWQRLTGQVDEQLALPLQTAVPDKPNTAEMWPALQQLPLRRLQVNGEIESIVRKHQANLQALLREITGYADQLVDAAYQWGQHDLTCADDAPEKGD